MHPSAPVLLVFLSLFASSAAAKPRPPAARSPRNATAAARPIFDTHVHLYQVSRDGGVPWPDPSNTILYKDMTPAVYKAGALEVGISGTGVMEASPLFDDNLKLLAMIKRDRFFRFVVAQLSIGAPDFRKQLDQLAAEPRVVGVRGFLWNPKLTLDEEQLADLKLLAKRGMTLDLIRRGDLNPTAKVIDLASKVPDLRIIIDHLGGARGAQPDPKWVDDMKALAAQPNISMKFSSLFDIYNPNPAGKEDTAWTSPTDPAAYKPYLDVLLATFGADRLIWGSNWPVVNLGGTLGQEVRVVEALLQPLGRKVRDKIMAGNAQRFYRRVPPRKRSS